MKLSEMLQNVTSNAKQIEEKLTEWENGAEKWASDAQQSAQAWLTDAEARMQQADKKFDDYLASATETVKSEWGKAEAALEQQVSQVQSKSEEMRKSIEAYEANTRAEAAEAYAAAMSKFAISVQNEAEKAIAFAAQNSGKADA